MSPKTWCHVSTDSPYSLANIPFGIVSTSGSNEHHPAIAIGDNALDLAIFAQSEGFSKCVEILQHLDVFQKPTLNDFAALGRVKHRAVRKYLQDVLRYDTPHAEVLKDKPELQDRCMFPLNKVQNHLPTHILNFTDFYGGMNHAINAGALFRGQAGALLPNYIHMPTAYHSRASSVVVSGTSIQRPWGQVIEDPSAATQTPTFATSKRLDFELELGVFVCQSNSRGETIPVSRADDALFGFVLLNDWSARDIQRWEYVPLGPFNGKNFGTSISAWVVLADALEPFRSKGLEPKHELLPYLKFRENHVYDLRLDAEIITKSGATAKICSTNAADGLVYSFPQMLAHHTISGCNMLVGDLLGSGTISGSEPGTLGCLLEQTSGGKIPIKLAQGEERAWLEDGDTIALFACAGDAETGLVGFGPCSGTIAPASSLAQIFGSE